MRQRILKNSLKACVHDVSIEKTLQVDQALYHTAPSGTKDESLEAARQNQKMILGSTEDAIDEKDLSDLDEHEDMHFDNIDRNDIEFEVDFGSVAFENDIFVPY